MTTAAITGDIGAGKSTAANLLAEKLSCPLLDADKIAAELWHDGKVKKIFVSRWGSEILDSSGEIIKTEISRRIFFNIEEYKFCNSILHPLVMKELGVRPPRCGGREELGVKHKNLVIEIPLLFEACEKKPAWIDKIIFVTANFETRSQRCFEQRGWSVDELKRRESFLMPREKKISMSDFVIYNDGTLEELKQKIFSLNF